MQATVILADAATTHPDGTFSLLRGGITNVHVPPDKPIVFRGALVARIVGRPGEDGPHNFKIVCIDEDGRSVSPDFTGTFEVPRGGGAINLALNMQLTLPKFGRYTFSVMVDRNQLVDWTLEAKERAPEKKT